MKTQVVAPEKADQDNPDVGDIDRLQKGIFRSVCERILLDQLSKQCDNPNKVLLLHRSPPLFRLGPVIN